MRERAKVGWAHSGSVGLVRAVACICVKWGHRKNLIDKKTTDSFNTLSSHCVEKD